MASLFVENTLNHKGFTRTHTSFQLTKALFTSIFRYSEEENTMYLLRCNDL